MDFLLGPLRHEGVLVTSPVLPDPQESRLGGARTLQGTLNKGFPLRRGFARNSTNKVPP